MGPRDPEVVDDGVRRQHGGEIATERVLLDQVAEPVGDLFGEVPAHLVVEERVVGERGVANRLLEAALRVGEQDAELGAFHAAPAAGALRHLLGQRQRLDLALEQPFRLEARHQVVVRLDPRGRDRRLLRQDLGLQVVVVEDVRRDVGLDRVEQLVALLHRQVSGGYRDTEEDLEVDLVVGRVDAGRVVDEVGVDAPAGARVLDPPALREAEVAALADDSRSHVLPVHPDGVVRAVADVGVGLVARLDERPDAAVPEEVDRRLQDRRHELGGRGGVELHAERLPRLRGELARLLLTRPDAAAGRELRAVVVVP